MSGANVSAAAIAQKVWSHPVSLGLRTLFYAATPNETSFATLPEVPDYIGQAIPFFITLQLLEIAWHTIKGRKDRLLRLNDALSSMVCGTMSLLPLVAFFDPEARGFIWFHDKLGYDTSAWLPWSSPWTWWTCMIGIDFCYYWIHRCSHEVNFMWAAHQVHHSSEDYNLSTALRQSALQRYSSWIFYLPMAFFIPPSIFVVHIQFNLLYQFWIHTEAIDSLGPLEYILNTPSHHRVHHGRNRYCIDKNYAGTLIIWDRIFGTFAWEKEEVVYGLIHPLNSWDSIYTQICHWKYMIRTAYKRRRGFWNKVFTFINGPGWSPGKPRLGDPEEIPELHAPQPKYDKTVPLWATLYSWIHYGLATVANSLVQMNRGYMTLFQALVMALYLLWTLTNIGYILEDRWYASGLELLRCVVYLVVDSYLCTSGVECSEWLYAVRFIFIASTTVWLLHSVKMINGYGKKKEE